MLFIALRLCKETFPKTGERYFVYVSVGFCLDTIKVLPPLREQANIIMFANLMKTAPKKMFWRKVADLINNFYFNFLKSICYFATFQKPEEQTETSIN